MRSSNGKLGVTGFCWGGGTTNWLATELGADMNAGVPYYGVAAETASVPKIKAPMLVQLAADDQRINETYPAYEAALKAAGVPYEIHTYPGTQHGFHNNSTPALPRGGGQALLGAHDRALQEASRLEPSRSRSEAATGAAVAAPKCLTLNSHAHPK